MADRYWKVSTSMGYVGTDSTEYLDVVDFLGWTEGEVEKADSSAIESELDEYARDYVMDMVGWHSEPCSKEDLD